MLFAGIAQFDSGFLRQRQLMFAVQVSGSIVEQAGALRLCAI
jgi:hypothetical protein